MIQKKRQNPKSVHNSKLWEILSTLNKRERKEFATFIQLSSLKVSQEAQDFLTILFDKLTSNEDVSKEELAKVHKVSLKMINYWMNHLLKALERYLIFRVMEPETNEYEVKLMLTLKEKGFQKNTTSQTKKVGKLLNSKKEQGHSYNYYRYLFYEHCLMEDRKNRSSDLYLSNFHYSLDAFFIENKLRASASGLNRKKIMSVNDGEVDMESILSYAQQQQFKDNLPIQLYLWVYQMYSSEDWEEYYNKIADKIWGYANDLSTDTLKELSLCLMNQAVKAVNIGRLEYAQKYLLTIIELIDRDLLMENNVLDYNRYLTIVHASLLSNQSLWLKDFIKKYTENLVSANKKAVKHLNFAQIYFIEGQYQEAENELAIIYKKNLNFKFDVFHKLSYEKLLIQIYLELNKDELLNSKLVSFRQWLKRQHKIPNSKKQVFFNFIEIVKKINKATSQKEKYEIIERIVLSDMKLGSLEKKWLKERLE